MTNRLESIWSDGFIQIPLRTAAESSSLLSTCGGDDHGIKDRDLSVLVSPRKFTQAYSRFEQLALSFPLSAFAMQIRYLHD